MPVDYRSISAVEKSRIRARKNDQGELARLRALNRELVEALRNIVLNAEIQPDARMGGSTDIYAVPTDDIENAEFALAKARKEG